jgi:hypothetical protein
VADAEEVNVADDVGVAAEETLGTWVSTTTTRWQSLRRRGCRRKLQSQTPMPTRSTWGRATRGGVAVPEGDPVGVPVEVALALSVATLEADAVERRTP